MALQKKLPKGVRRRSSLARGIGLAHFYRKETKADADEDESGYILASEGFMKLSFKDHYDYTIIQLMRDFDPIED